MSSDPGFVPKSASRSTSKAVIDELMELRQFDEQHFCVNCMVRKPLRSKHCKRCERCVAKTDQYVMEPEPARIELTVVVIVLG